MPTVNLTLTGQAFASVNDTNVTLTLGGTPLTALLKGVSITAGWTGQLSVARGGTGLGSLGTANQLLRVNALGTALEYFTPSYGTVTAVTGSGNITSSGGATPNITFTGVLPTANGGTGVNIATTALTLGTASTTAGQLTLSNATNAFTQTIRGTNPSASIIYDLPTTAPTAGQVLQSTAPVAGVATLSWGSASSGITINGTAITSGTDYRVLFQDATASDYVTQTANFTMGAVASGFLDVPTGYAIGGIKTIVTTSAASGGIFIGYSNSTIPTPTQGSTWVGAIAGAAVTGTYNTLIGSGQYGFGAGARNVAIGGLNSVTHNSGLNSTISIGYNAIPTASNQGVLGSNNASGYVTDWYFNGVTHTAPYSVTLNASGASGTNVAGGNLTISSGKNTGNSTSSYIAFSTPTAGASGTTLQTLAERWRIASNTGNFSNTGSAGTAYIHLKAGTATASTAPLKFTTGTLNTTAEAGAMEFLAERFTLTPTSTARQTISGVLFTQTASATVANTVTETTLVGTGVGTTTLPANFFVEGKTLRIIFRGIISDTGTPTARIRAKLGSTTIGDTGAIALTGTVTNEEWEVDYILTCRTTGGTGTVFGQGTFHFDNSASSGLTFGMPSTAATTIDTTASQVVSVTIEWGAADAANTITSTNGILEVLN